MGKKPFSQWLRGHTLRWYGQVLDLVVIVLLLIMLLTLLGAVVGLVDDFVSAITTLNSTATPFPSHELAKRLGRELVINVLSVFILIELFRTFTDYLEFHRIRLQVLADVGITFLLREVFIGLYSHRMDWRELLSMAVLLAVLVGTRIAAIRFPPGTGGT
ncbi:MAG: phosphate-starvation-inducible PsiE family protein [Acidithiobacillus sp.]